MSVVVFGIVFLAMFTPSDDWHYDGRSALEEVLEGGEVAIGDDLAIQSELLGHLYDHVGVYAFVCESAEVVYLVFRPIDAVVLEYGVKAGSSAVVGEVLEGWVDADDGGWLGVCGKVIGRPSDDVEVGGYSFVQGLVFGWGFDGDHDGDVEFAMEEVLEGFVLEVLYDSVLDGVLVFRESLGVYVGAVLAYGEVGEASLDEDVDEVCLDGIRAVAIHCYAVVVDV